MHSNDDCSTESRFHKIQAFVELTKKQTNSQTSLSTLTNTLTTMMFLSVNVSSPTMATTSRKKPVVSKASPKSCLLQNKKSINRKTVSFTNTSTTYEVQCLVEPEDSDLHFYLSGDFRCFRLRDKHIVEAMRSHVSVQVLEEDLGECTRGLEKEQPEMKKRAHAHKKAAYAVVFSQQDCLANQDTIANAYGRFSRAASRDALIMGRLDAKFAQEFASVEGSEKNAATTETTSKTVKTPLGVPRKTVQLYPSKLSVKSQAWQMVDPPIARST